MNKNYYSILGLDKNATDEQIKKAYKKLAIKYHPDKNGGDKASEEKFKEISEAYSTLGDPEKKKQYDVSSPHGKNYSTNPFASFGFGFNPINDIWNDLFNNVGNPFADPFGRSNHYREFHENLDISINVIVSLRDVYKGDPIKVSYDRYVNCEDCEGTGFDRNSDSYACDMCNGTGKSKMYVPCEYCLGHGKIYTGTCKTCNGEKIKVKKTEFNLNNIKSIRKSGVEYLKNYGHQSKYYRNKVGVLSLNIIYEHINQYDIIGDTLQYNVNLHYQDAIDGCELIYETLDGRKLKINIPPKTNDKDVVRLKNQGLLLNVKERGDLLIKINIIIDYERIKNL